MYTITIQDLNERTDELIRNAEAGHLSLITKHGQPIFLAVPFKDEFKEWGIHIAIAIHLYKEEVLSLARAATLAQDSLENFIKKLGTYKIPVINYSPQDLEDELSSFKKE